MITQEHGARLSARERDLRWKAAVLDSKDQRVLRAVGRRSFVGTTRAQAVSRTGNGRSNEGYCGLGWY